MTEYCGFVKFTREHRESLVCVYRVRNTITEAKTAFLEFVKQQEEHPVLGNCGRKVSLVHIVKSANLDETELLQQYKEEVGC